jgi:hypothetical protein
MRIYIDNEKKMKRKCRLIAYATTGYEAYLSLRTLGATLMIQYGFIW